MKKNRMPILLLLIDNLIWVILVVVVALFSIFNSRYLTEPNLVDILVTASVLGILVVGQTFVLITGNFDLSAEGVVGLSAGIAVWLQGAAGQPTFGSGWHVNVVFAFVALFAVGAATGTINGFLITKVKMNNFIVTLAMMIVLEGMLPALSTGSTMSGAPASFNWLGTATIGTFPICGIVLIITFVGAHLVLKHRPFGRDLYAIGGNPQAAFASGINPNRRVYQAYIISGILAAFAGLILEGQVQSVPADLGNGMIFMVFAAAVIGGISLQGGRGNIIGAFGGVLLLAAITDGLNLLAVDVYFTSIIEGLIILAAVFLDTQKTRLHRIVEGKRAIQALHDAAMAAGEAVAIPPL